MRVRASVSPLAWLVSAIVAQGALACGGASKAAAPPPAPESSEKDASAGAVDAAPPPVMSGEVRRFERASAHSKADKIGTKDGAFEPDGVADAIYDVDLDGPATALFLVSTDDRGEPNGEATADTLTGADVLPEAISALGGLGKHTGGIAVYEQGSLKNAPDGHLPPLSAGRHALVIHVSMKDLPRSGAFRLFARFTDGSVVKGPLAPVR